MSKPWSGRCSWVWYLSQCGGIGGAITLAKQQELDGVFVKEGGDEGGGARAWNQLSAPEIQQFKDAGLKVSAWLYAVGKDNAGIVRLAQECRDRGYDGVIIDAEAEISRVPGAAADLAVALATTLQGYPLAVAPVPVMKFFPGLEYQLWYDYGFDMIPQFYTNVLSSTNYPLSVLFDMWLSKFDASRLYPAYGMYEGVNGYPTVDELTEFTTRSQDCGGYSYWRLDTVVYDILEQGDVGMNKLTQANEDDLVIQLGALWGIAQGLREIDHAEEAAAIEAAVAAVTNTLGLNS